MEFNLWSAVLKSLPAVGGVWKVVLPWMVGPLVLVAGIYWSLGRFLEGFRDRAQERRFQTADLSAIDRMSGEEFERYLALVFKTEGFAVRLTAQTGDYGVDLILTHPKSKIRIAVQAKRQRGLVGIAAVQEVHLGMKHYGCQMAYVITNSTFSPNAKVAAESARVRLVDRKELAKIINKFKSKHVKGTPDSST